MRDINQPLLYGIELHFDWPLRVLRILSLSWGVIFLLFSLGEFAGVGEALGFDHFVEVEGCVEGFDGVGGLEGELVYVVVAVAGLLLGGERGGAGE